MRRQPARRRSGTYPFGSSMRNKYFLTMALVCAGASGDRHVAFALAAANHQVVRPDQLSDRAGERHAVRHRHGLMILWGRRSDGAASARGTPHPAHAGRRSAIVATFSGMHRRGPWSAAGLRAAGAYASKGPFWALSAGWLSAATLAAGLAGINAIANLVGGGLMVNIVGLVKEATGSFALGMLPVAALDAAAAISVILISRSHARDARAVAAAA